MDCANKFYDIGLKTDELQKNLGGGLPKNSFVLVEGPDGTGKSLLAQRFAYSLLQNDVNLSYISSELNTLFFVEQMNSLNYDIQSFLFNKKLDFFPMFPFGVKSHTSNDLFQKFLESEHVFKNEVIIFDSLSFFHMKKNLEHSDTYDIVSRLKHLTTLGKTIIFCIDPENINMEFLGLIRNVSDLYLKLNHTEIAGDRINNIFVNRFKRPLGSVNQIIPFKVEPGKGISINISSLN